MLVKFYTLGCKVNQYETQGLIEDFSAANCIVTKGKADLYIINTCSVTAKADAKSKELILRAKKENPSAKIAVCGCLAQLNREKIKKIGADYIIPQSDKQNTADIIFGNKSGKPKDIWSLKINNFFNHRAFLKVQDGCDNICSFCKVPGIRGRSKSRNKPEIIEEIKRLSKNHAEIVLCGINLAVYGRDLNPALTLKSLVEEILEVKELGRLRLSSLEPFFIKDNFLSLFSHGKLCPHLHLPFQSGDDKVLKAMRKKENVSLYKYLVNRVKSINPDIAISCDIMTGFPAEGKDEFKNTVNFIEEIKPMRMHVFTFSPRDNTVFDGATVTNKKEIEQRAKTLKSIAMNLARDYYLKFIDKDLEVVAEEYGDNITIGYSQNYIKVSIKDNLELGKTYPVKICEVKNHKVFGFPSRTGKPA